MLSSCYQRFSLKNYWSDIYKKQDYYEFIVYLLLFIYFFSIKNKFTMLKYNQYNS